MNTEEEPATSQQNLDEWNRRSAPSPEYHLDSPLVQPESNWELMFLYFSVFLYAVWFGITAEAFEGLMGLCTVAVFMGFLIMVLGKFIKSDPLASNTRNLFYISIFFSMTSCLFHFIRLKIDPIRIM